jgi:ATP-binding cassette subfamily F protein 3
MIRVKQLSKYYGDHDLFYDVDININAKEKIGLIGRNGSGKSTFLKILLGEENHDEGHIEKSKNFTIQSLEQHMDFTEPTILAQVCQALPPTEFGQEWKAESILMGLGFTKNDFTRAPDEFSSGMQVRLRLAQALVSEADLLLLDEPTNYLDILSLRWLERFLSGWKGAFILVTHDQTFMEKVVSQTIGIHRGKMRKMRGGPSKLMDQIYKEEEVHERTRQKQEKKDAKTKLFIRNFRAGARSAGLVQSRIKSLAKQKIHRKLAKLPQIKFNFKFEPFQGSQLLRATNLYFDYPKESNLSAAQSAQKRAAQSENGLSADPLIKKFSLSVRPKDRIAIIGPNGKGKSTLLKLLTGELEAQTGKLKQHVNLSLGYFGPSQVKALNPQNSILVELMSLPKAKEQLVRSIAGALLFTGNSIKKPISALSGGERSRVGLAKLMLEQHNLLVLDEPTNHLDMESCKALSDSLKNFPGTILFVSHDERLISQIATRLVVFENGQIDLIEKSYQDFLDSGGWAQEEQTRTSFYKPRSANKQEYESRKARNKEERSIQKELEKLQKKLEKMEEQQEKNTTLLGQAYSEGHSQNQLDYGAVAKDLAHEINAGYKRLEELLEREEELN